MKIDKSVVKRLIDNARPTNLHLYTVSPTDKDSGKRVTSNLAKLLDKNPTATVVVMLH